MAKKLTPVRLSEKTLNQISELIKIDPASNLPSIIEQSVSRMSESKTDKRLRKIYKASKKTYLALRSKKDFEGLSGLEENILSTIFDLTEYIEELWKED